jgi:hypothetical protein
MDESVFTVLYRHWIWIGPPLMVAAVLALVVLIQGTVAMVRSSVLLRVPLAEAQEVHFDHMGPVSLAIEGPQGSRRFAGVSFALTSLSGEPVAGRPVLFRMRTSGFSKARLELMRFDLPFSGGYRLHVKGLGEPREKDSAHAVVFTRPHTAETVAFILGIVLASAVLITSLVFLVMRLLGVRPGA